MADPRRADAERFLAALAPDGGLTFQTFDDAKPRRRELSRVLHGSYGRQAGTLSGLNGKGAGVFVMVNRGDGKGRKAGNVTEPRAVFLDLDGAPLAPVLAAPIPPPIVCESSPGKHHAYWPVAEMPLADFRCAQQTLAERYVGDPKVCDLPRVMRLPGYLHAKGEPCTSRLLHCDPTKPWQWPVLAEALGLPQGRAEKPLPDTILEGDRNNTLFGLARGLVNKGYNLGQVSSRLQKINATRCAIPLCASEVDAIVISAREYRSQGFVQLPHSLLDSEAFRSLPPAGKEATIALLRGYNGANNGRIALPMTEAALAGLKNKRRAKGLAAMVAAGLLEYAERGRSGTPGHRATPDRFRLLFLP